MIFNFFNKKYHEKIPVATVRKKVMGIVLLYLGMVSLTIKKELTTALKQQLPFCNIQFAFKTNCRMSSWFKFKDEIPRSLISDVVYRYNCPRCNSKYVGSTFKYCMKRLEEHLHISAVTGKPVMQKKTVAL